MVNFYKLIIILRYYNELCRYSILKLVRIYLTNIVIKRLLIILNKKIKCILLIKSLITIGIEYIY